MKLYDWFAEETDKNDSTIILVNILLTKLIFIKKILIIIYISSLKI